MNVLTEDVLDIVWTEEEGQDFRKGVIAFALFCGADAQEPPFPTSVWQAGTRKRSGWLTDEGRQIHVWTILPSNWPTQQEWCSVLESTLRACLEVGAIVAWCGLEGGDAFAFPPSLFDPDVMTGLETEPVYAALLPDRFVCRAELHKPYSALTRSDMIEFMTATNERISQRR